MCDDIREFIATFIREHHVDPSQELIMERPFPGRGFTKTSCEDGITKYKNYDHFIKVYIHDEDKRNKALTKFRELLNCMFTKKNFTDGT